MFRVGDKVKNTDPRLTSVPRDCLGVVVDGPNCSYGVTVRWDGVDFQTYHDTKYLNHVDARKHAVYDPCDGCGKTEPVFSWLPDAVMGCVLVRGNELIDCRNCGRRLFFGQ